MANAFTWKSARHPLGDAENFSAEFRLAEAAHALQQLPLDAIMLPARVIQAQLHLLCSASRNVYHPGNWTFLLQDLADTPDILFPACCRLIWALADHSKTPINQQAMQTQNAVILGYLQGIQQITGHTNTQLTDFTTLLQALQPSSSSRGVESQVSHRDKTSLCSCKSGPARQYVFSI